MERKENGKWLQIKGKKEMVFLSFKLQTVTHSLIGEEEEISLQTMERLILSTTL